MKTTPINAGSAPKAMGGYSQGILIEDAARFVFISGQIPERADGTVPSGFEAQAHQVWANVLAQLEVAQMSASNLVKVTTFLSSRQHAEANGRIRREYLHEHRPALTVVVTGIFDERWLVEIEAVAAA